MIEDHPLGEPGELAAWYASGAMSDDELREFNAHLATGCERCRSEIKKLDPAVIALSQLAPPKTPSSATRAAILSRVVGERRQRPSHASSSADSGREPECFVLPANAGSWKPSGHEGIEVRTLYVDRMQGHATMLVRMRPGAVYPPHRHEGAEECLIIEGDLRIGDRVLRSGDFLRTPPGFVQIAQTTVSGCLLYLTTPLE